MNNFWQQLPKPFTVLAPMDGVTDVVFRNIINNLGRPNVYFTEFTSCEGLLSKGGEAALQRLRTFPGELPVVAQIWGINPDNFYKAAKLIKPLGFAGIDINMGCPDREVIKKGACSALIKNPKLAAEVILATKEGAGKDTPISVKTRIGFNSIEIEEWLGFLLTQDLPALTVHLRTVKEMSKVPAHWDLMTQIVSLRDSISPKTLLIGNGDLASLSEVNEKFEEYGNEGFMIGRGIFQNPWMFNPEKEIEKVSVKDRIELYQKHIELFAKTWGPLKNPAIIKKFCKTYINSFPDAVSLREKLMAVNKRDELVEVLKAFKMQINA
jgi:tRNA-dihydrouridine synthase